jgi:ferredoxin--NADP+ reductase
MEKIMPKLVTDGAGNSMIFTAKLLSSKRITPESSREEIRQMVFHTDDPYFDSKVGSCIRILAPGQYGNPYHTRLYSIADTDQTDGGAQFEICVRRCFYTDETNGEEYEGVASNYLCDLQPGSIIKFSGPVGYPFVVPENLNANLLMIGMGTGIAPFRGLIRMIYEKHGGWKGKVRLFHGARTGMEMLYLNDANNDLGNYFDQPTFKAFQAVSPRPAFNAPIAMDKALEQNAAEVWEIVNSPDSRVYVAGMTQMLGMIDDTMTNIAGSSQAWMTKRNELVSAGRWAEILY